MTGKLSSDFDGFILPNGELVSIQDTDRMFSFLTECNEGQHEITNFLWGLVQECIDRGYYRASCDYLEKILCLTDDPGEKAECLLRMGVAMEQAEAYQTALESYLRAFEFPQKSDEFWYYLNNNTAYCLNKTGQYLEAERYCRVAIDANPNRHNAHKNLGIALQHQARYVEAAKCFVDATRLCPTDARALAYLEELIFDHREILSEVPELLGLLQEVHHQAHENKQEFYVQ